MKIKVKLIGDTTPIKTIVKGDWIDLYVREDTIVPDKYTMVKIPLGIAMELPKGYEALIVPRSNTPIKYSIMLANSIDVIDNSYNGNTDEWSFLAKNITLNSVCVPKGARIAQFRIQLSQKANLWQKIQWLFSSKIEFEYVDILTNQSRGGYGTTGI